ncbi:MAG: T9SS type A sorting domain-containing protein [Candidatus Cloacimonetes bacterium]|nr:T9SS type A sorting domain-containing protein [Candidatus Cloacimonadota bacterium]
MLTETTELTYTDQEVSNNTQYTYGVSAVFASGSSEEEEFTIVVVYFAPPTNLRAAFAINVVNLSWEEPEEEDINGLVGYKIYRDDEPLSLNTLRLDVLSYIDSNINYNVEYTYHVTSIFSIEDDEYESDMSNIVVVFTEDDITSSEEEYIPHITELQGNFPNPFNPETTIVFTLHNPSYVSIEIYNIKGQKVHTLVNANMKPGKYSSIWNGTDDNGRNLSSGVYFYKMQTDEYTSVKRMLLMK